MELVVQILILFIIINCSIKLSFWKLWQVAIFGLTCSLFIILTYEYATQQSKTQIASFLADKIILQNTSVLVTIESAICFAYSFMAINQLYSNKPSRFKKILHFYPSLLIYPVIFYILTQLIFTLSGYSFANIAYGFAVLVFLLSVGLSYLIKYLLPEKELRLETHFLVSLFVCILGLITTVNGEVTYTATGQDTNFRYLAIAFGIFAIMFLVGFIWSRVKWRFKKK